MEIEDVQSQMRDEGCDDLSELNQIIELEQEKFQKSFVSKGKEGSEAGLRQKDKINRLEQLRSTLIALSSPDESKVGLHKLFCVCLYLSRLFVN